MIELALYVGEVSHRSQGVGVLRTKHSPPNVKNLLVKITRRRRLTQPVQGVGEVVHRSQRVGMLRTKNPTANVKNLPVKITGCRILTQPEQSEGEVVHRDKGLPVFKTKDSAAKVDGLLAEASGGGVLPCGLMVNDHSIGKAAQKCMGEVWVVQQCGGVGQ